jgi:putative ABC transport system permease protein
MIRLWLAGIVGRRWGRLLAATVGTALGVALLASVGSFLAASTATMTSRASAGVAVDWQVEIARDRASETPAVLKSLRQDPSTVAAVPVGFANTPGLGATTRGTTQSTGAGRVLGIPANWRTTFPLAMRLLTGSTDGVLIAQQTAANLQVQTGDHVTIKRAGLPSYSETVAGVVELPQADSLFQKVGAPPGSQLSAPPDNVVLLPAKEFAHRYDALQRSRPDQVGTQIHVRRSHALPDSPASAFVQESGQARNSELATSGAGVVGDNLGTVLDAARGDAAYARILFLFLGLPGVVLAGLVTTAVARSGAERRRREQELLRARGATTSRLWGLVLAETALVSVAGSVLGLGAALLVGWLSFGSPRFGASTSSSLAWSALAAAVGIITAVLAVALPARKELSVKQGTRSGADRPRWLAYGFDIVLLLVAGALFLAAGRNKYTLVLAPEGVPTLSVSYWAFLAPALAWIGSGLLTWRLADLLLGPGRGVLARLLRPVTGNLSGPSSAMLSRQRSLIARSVVLVALALSFSISTATFNATYKQQAEVDAQLTNGADVTVTQSPGQQLDPGLTGKLEKTSGVKAVEQMQHRFAYVGSDLQDLYGINPSTIRRATSLQDPYFQGATADQSLQRLSSTPDGILVSAETVNDFQLAKGDHLKLRLQDARTGRYQSVTFSYVGIANEFPTAPKDSFLVANSSYVARQTGNDAIGTYLVRTDGNIKDVAARVRSIVGTQGQVGTIDDARGLVSSSLTSIDMSGLTKLELSFAILLVAAAGGVVVGLSLNERRRTLAVLVALGARKAQLARLNRAEPVLVIVVGTALGVLAGWGLSHVLVKMLTGVFDPPPSSLAFPWIYLLVVVAAVPIAISGAAGLVLQRTRLGARDVLREG